MRHAKCLCKNADGTPCGYIGTEKSITWHLRKSHGSGRKAGVNFEYTEEPVNFQKHKTEGKRPYHRKNPHNRTKDALLAGPSVTVDIPCILRVNSLTGERVVILGGSE